MIIKEATYQNGREVRRLLNSNIEGDVHKEKILVLEGRLQRGKAAFTKYRNSMQHSEVDQVKI